MHECASLIDGPHQEELLKEVARVMQRPSKPETDGGKRARLAAKELLRAYGRAGTTAFRAAQREGMPWQQRDPHAMVAPHVGGGGGGQAVQIGYYTDPAGNQGTCTATLLGMRSWHINLAYGVSTPRKSYS